MWPTIPQIRTVEKSLPKQQVFHESPQSVYKQPAVRKWRLFMDSAPPYPSQPGAHAPTSGPLTRHRTACKQTAFCMEPAAHVAPKTHVLGTAHVLRLFTCRGHALARWAPVRRTDRKWQIPLSDRFLGLSQAWWNFFFFWGRKALAS